MNTSLTIIDQLIAANAKEREKLLQLRAVLGGRSIITEEDSRAARKAAKVEELEAKCRLHEFEIKDGCVRSRHARQLLGDIKHSTFRSWLDRRHIKPQKFGYANNSPNWFPLEAIAERLIEREAKDF